MINATKWAVFPEAGALLILIYLRIVFCCRGTSSQFAIIPITKCPDNHAIKWKHQCVIETTWHLKKQARLVLCSSFFIFPQSIKDCTILLIGWMITNISYLPHMIPLKGSHPLRQHLVGCWPQTQTTRFTTAKGEQFPICCNHSWVPEATCKLGRESHMELLEDWFCLIFFHFACWFKFHDFWQTSFKFWML